MVINATSPTESQDQISQSDGFNWVYLVHLCSVSFLAAGGPLNVICSAFQTSMEFSDTQTNICLGFDVWSKRERAQGKHRLNRVVALSGTLSVPTLWQAKVDDLPRSERPPKGNGRGHKKRWERHSISMCHVSLFKTISLLVRLRCMPCELRGTLLKASDCTDSTTKSGQTHEVKPRKCQQYVHKFCASKQVRESANLCSRDTCIQTHTHIHRQNIKRVSKNTSLRTDAKAGHLFFAFH